MSPASKALIIFARYPRPGEVKTRLGATIGMEKAAEVYRLLAEHAFSVARELSSEGARLCLFFDPSVPEKQMREWIGDGFTLFPQKGEDLGERMRNAFGTVFEEGASTGVIVGSDIPALDAHVIREGFGRLETDPVVIGPSADGGYYLLGMQKGVADLFSGVRWSTEHVLQDTVTKLRGMNIRYGLLREMGDADTREDWERLML